MVSDGSEVVAVEGRVYRCPVAEPFGYAKGLIEARESAVARVVTADGTVGWGEAFAPAAAARDAVERIGRNLLGRSVFERRAFWQEDGPPDRAVPLEPAAAAARSALALAAADAAAKLAGLPLRALLGGSAAPSLRVYASALWFRQAADPTVHYGDALRAAREQGFGAVKAKVGLGPEADRRALERMGDAGEGLALMADANQAYAPADAAAVAETAAAIGLVWLEEPLPPDQLDAYAELRHRSRVAIAGGETVTSLGDARRWLDASAVDILQPDICLGGGVETAVVVSDLAAERGVVVAPHCFGLGLGLAASLHWASTIRAGDGAAPVWIEVDTSPNPARDALLAGCAWFGEGGLRLEVPTEPGLGVDLDRIERFRVR